MTFGSRLLAVTVDNVEMFCWKPQQQLQPNVGGERAGMLRDRNFVGFSEMANDEKSADKPAVQIG